VPNVTVYAMLPLDVFTSAGKRKGK
jgi:hypothetical protein